MSAQTADTFWDELAERPKPPMKRGRYDLPGGPYTRATNHAAILDDRHNLEAWGKRMVLLGAANRPDLCALAAANTDDKKKLDEYAEQAIEAAKGTAARNLGTALHTYTEKVDSGVAVTIPAPWDADIAAYQATLAANGITIIPDLIERTVICTDLGVAGTFDRVVEWHGRRYIADLKTGGFLPLLSIAVQLSIYANADRMWAGGDTLVDAPAVDRDVALIIHLPAGEARCEILTVDIAEGWRLAKLAAQVKAARNLRALSSTLAEYASDTAPPTRLGWLTGRVRAIIDAGHGPDLAAGWPPGVPTLKQGGLDDKGIDAGAAACNKVEEAHALEFGDPDPATTPQYRTALLGPEQADYLRAFVEAARIPNRVSAHNLSHTKALTCALDLIDADMGNTLADVWAATGTLTKFATSARAVVHGKAVFAWQPDGTLQIQPTPKQKAGGKQQ